MSIARLLIERHEGRIGFDSEPGNGTIFWFELPLHDPKAEPAPASAG